MKYIYSCPSCKSKKIFALKKYNFKNLKIKIVEIHSDNHSKIRLWV